MSPASARTRVAAPVLEVFASIQGEGAYVGEPQVFLRLRGCPLRCRWCDTPGSWSLAPGDRARVRHGAESRSEDAWATPFQAACWVAAVEPGEPRTVSVTGGEPLLWPGFLRALPSVLGGRRLHLETGGGHPEALAEVLEVFHHVSLDLKLPADLDAPVEVDAGVNAERGPRTSEAPPRSAREWARARRRCLDLVAERDACAKVVVSGGHAAREYEPLFEDLARRAPRVPLFLQPVTPRAGVPAPDAGELTAVVELARDLDLRVRVVPQVHRALRLP